MNLIEAGKIVTTHGIKGEACLEIWCDNPEFLLDVDTFYISEGKPLKVQYSRVHKNRLNVKFEGRDSIEAVQEIMNKILYIDRAEKKLEKGVYYVADLMGLSVVDCDSGEEYGVVTDVVQTGANDVYEVKKNEKCYYSPAIKDVIISVNLDKGQMAVKPMAGMFEL